MQEKIRANGYEMPNAICLVIHYHTLWYLLSLSQQRCQGISLTSEKDRGMGWGDCIYTVSSIVGGHDLIQDDMKACRQ